MGIGKPGSSVETLSFEAFRERCSQVARIASELFQNLRTKLSELE
jgi:hypothetical protein